MNANKVALRIIDAVKPLADDLRPKFRKKLSRLLISDLCKITSICIMPERTIKSIKPQELDLILLVFSSIKVFWGGVTCGPFSLPAQVIEKLQNWDSINSKEKKSILLELEKTLHDDLKKCFKKYNKVNFETPEAVKRMDRRYNSDYYHGIVTTLYGFAMALVMVDETISPEKDKMLKKIWRILSESETMERGAATKKDVLGDLKEKKDEETIQDILKELDSLIGLENIKKEVRTLVNFLEVQKERMKRGLPGTKLSLHSVFLGPPGTGKTSVARLISKIFYQLGFLEKGHLVETDRAGLVGAYIGHTSQKVDSKVNEALGGVLFIDEAYALKPDEGSDVDFGQEAIDILLKRMEDYRDNFVVIVAGYPDEMKRFINSNPGLKSRFNRYFYFDHYKPEDLLEIFKIFCKKAHYNLTRPAEKKIFNLLKYYYLIRDRTFGNGRLSRNLFEKIIGKQANRLAECTNLTDKEIIKITVEDIPEYKDKKNEVAKASNVPDWLKERTSNYSSKRSKQQDRYKKR